MSKPKDIPQDVWEKACALVPDYVKATIKVGIARAIMAAKAEEREHIAQIGDALCDLFDGHAIRCAEEVEVVEARGAESAVRNFVAEIRKRGGE